MPLTKALSSLISRGLHAKLVLHARIGVGFVQNAFAGATSETVSETDGFRRHMRQWSLEAVGGAYPQDRRDVIDQSRVGAEARRPARETTGLRSFATHHQTAAIGKGLKSRAAERQIECPDQIGAAKGNVAVGAFIATLEAEILPETVTKSEVDARHRAIRFMKIRVIGRDIELREGGRCTGDQYDHDADN